MKQLITLIALSFTATFAHAHCPIDLGAAKNMCAEITWVTQPKLNVKPTDKFYAEADILIFEKGDSSHVPVKLQNIEIYPSMKMPGMSSHGTRYSLSLKPNGHYKLAKMRFIHSTKDWFIRFSDVVNGTYDINKFFAESPVVFPGASTAPTSITHDHQH